MKKYLILFSLLLCISCGNLSTENYNNSNDSISNDTINISYGMSMRNSFEQNFTKEQFDSICKADTISNDLEQWKSIVLTDNSNYTSLNEYMYIKSLGDKECIYRLVKNNNNTYKITKRITVK